MADHHRISSNIKPRLFTTCFNRANDRANVEEKPYCSFVSMVWWHGYKDYGGFTKQLT